MKSFLKEFWPLILFAVLGLIGLFWLASCESHTRTDAPQASTTRTEVKEQLNDSGKIVSRTTTTTNAQASGVGGEATGDKASQTVHAEPAEAGIDESGNPAATGGGGNTKQAASSANNAAKWTLIGLGVLFGIGAAISFYADMKRASVVCGTVSLGCFVAAFNLTLAIFILAAILLVKFGPYLLAEWQKKRAMELNRATVAAIQNGPPIVKDEFKRQADPHDLAAFAKVVGKDQLV